MDGAVSSIPAHTPSQAQKRDHREGGGIEGSLGSFGGGVVLSGLPAIAPGLTSVFQGLSTLLVHHHIIYPLIRHCHTCPVGLHQRKEDACVI